MTTSTLWNNITLNINCLLPSCAPSIDKQSIYLGVATALITVIACKVIHEYPYRQHRYQILATIAKNEKRSQKMFQKLPKTHEQFSSQFRNLREMLAQIPHKLLQKIEQTVYVSELKVHVCFLLQFPPILRNTEQELYQLKRTIQQSQTHSQEFLKEIEDLQTLLPLTANQLIQKTHKIQSKTQMLEETLPKSVEKFDLARVQILKKIVFIHEQIKINKRIRARAMQLQQQLPLKSFQEAL